MPQLDDLKDALRASFRTVTDTKGMGSFILGFCFIEWLAGYYFGRKTNGQDYREFVQRFLPRYNANKMYSHLRCGLVHGFTDKGKGYDFREDRATNHLKMAKLKGSSKSRQVINLSNFQEDLESAMERLFSSFDKDPKKASRALNRFEKVGMVIGSVETE